MTDRKQKLLLAFLVVTLCIMLAPRFIKTKDPKGDLRTYLQELTYDKSSRVKALAYNPECQILGVGYETGMVEFHDTNGKRKPLIFKAHDMRVSSITISDDGAIALTNSYFDNETRIWNLKEGTLTTTIENARVKALIYDETDDHKTIFACGSGSIKIYDTSSGVYEDEYDIGGSSVSMNFSPDKRWLAVGTSTGGVVVWEITRQETTPVLVKQGTIQPYEVGNWVINVTFSQSGDTLHTVTRKGQVDSWNVPNLERENHFVSDVNHVSSTVALGTDPSSFILLGTRDNRGMGKTHGELVDLESGTNKLVFRRVASHPIPLVFPSINTLMVASGKKFHLIDISGFLPKG